MSESHEETARDVLLSGLQARLDRPESLLSDRALADVVALILARDPGVDLPVLHVVGWTFYLRHAALHDQAAKLVNFIAACQLLGPVWRIEPEAVPPVVAAFYTAGNEVFDHFSATTGFSTDHNVWLTMSRPYTRRFIDHQDAVALRLSIGLLRLAVLSALADRKLLAHCQSLLASQVALLRPIAEDPETNLLSAEENGRALLLLSERDRPYLLHLLNRAAARVATAQESDDAQLLVAAVEDFRAALAICSSSLDPLVDEDQIRLGLGSALGLLAGTGAFQALDESLDLLRRVADGGGERAAEAAHNFEATIGAVLRRARDRPAEVTPLIDLFRARAAAEAVGGPSSHALLYLLVRRSDTSQARLDDLREAAALGRLALTAPSSDRAVQVALMLNLCSTLRTLGYETGDLDLLDEAIELARAAVRRSGRPAGLALASLSSCLACRFDLRGDRTAQREALEASRSAVADMPADDPDRATVLENHAAILRNAAAMASDAGPLREAIAIRRQLAARGGAPPHVQTRQLGALGELLRDLAVRTRGEERLQAARDAVQACRDAISVGGPDDPHLNTYLGNLGRALRYLEELQDTQDEASGALAASRRAVEATRRENPWWAFHMYHLGVALSDTGDPEAALAAFTDAANAPTVRANVRINCERMRSRIALRLDRPDIAMEAIDRAVALLATAAPADQLRGDRQHMLDQFHGLTDDIVAVCVRADRPDRAVELLEQARGRLMAESLGNRRETDEIAAFDAGLAKLFREAAQRLRDLDTAEAAPGATVEEERELVARRRAATAAWTSVVERIRVETPLTDFLAPAAATALQEQGGAGPIVLVAAGHAFILDGSAGPPRRIELDQFSHKAAKERLLTFLAARSVATDDSYSVKARRSGQRAVTGTLAWLWDAAAAPILDALDPAPGTRLWWCPIGLLSLFPWHAAGHHDGTRSVLDRVVSSYTASVGALAHTRSRPARAEPPSLLLVADPDRSLGGVDEEIRRIGALIPGAEVIAGPAATKPAVLAALGSHSMVHFACHAVSDLEQSARSRLILADHAEDPLVVGDLSALHLDGKELAVLAACSTVETRPTGGDEALHLSAAFQLAGYRHVIGSLWPVSDGVAATVAERVYGRLTDHGRRPADCSGTAVALHEAVLELRAQYGAAPTIWASYVHTGV